MFIVYDQKELDDVALEAFAVAPGKPVLLDKFLEDAVELDVDCISDGETTVVGGMLQHIEFAGVHSGDAAMVHPPHDLSEDMIDTVRIKAGHIPCFKVLLLLVEYHRSRHPTILLPGSLLF